MICPKCNQKLIQKDKSFVCEQGHNYDIARQGYVNLMLTNSQTSGDSKEMVLARNQFLEKGYYRKLKETCVEIVSKKKPDVLVDLGCGEGYYTSSMSESTLDCYGIDLSKEALKIAARNDKHTQYIIASIFHLPIDSNSVDMVTNIFAPTPIEEVTRILKTNGIYVIVAPHTHHLYEFKQAIYEEAYENKIEMIQDDHFELVNQIQVDDMITLTDSNDIEALFMMTPYYWKSSKKTSQKVKELKEITTRISFDVQIYKKTK